LQTVQIIFTKAKQQLVAINNHTGNIYIF